MTYGVSMRVVSRVLLSVVLSLVLLPAHAEKTYADEYQNRIKSASNVQAHGETPFGESTDLYTGSTTFSQTDLVLEGKGPPIRITRTSADFDESASNPFQFTGFGDWQLEVPMIETIAPGTLKYNSTVGEWKVSGPSSATTDRCTYFGGMWTPPDGYYGPRSLTVPADSWWRGYTLKIPGVGSQPILARLAATPTPATGNYPGVTTQHYQIGCQAGLGTTNGQPGEGFVVLAPDGTKYFMTHLSYAPYETYIERDPMDIRIKFEVGRVIARMKASRVEDRFGNYITYTYTGDKLTAISASDGRSLTLQWWSDAPLIQSISANGRTWTYNYASRSAAGGTLSQVILPDNTAWTFTGAVPGAGSSPVSFGGCIGNFSYGPNPQSSAGVTYTYSVKHPSGVIGTFRYSGRLRSQSYAATMCASDTFSQTMYETSNPYFSVLALVEREISGPGMPNSLWTYAYQPEQVSRYLDCVNIACPSTTYTDVVDPSGYRTRYVHSTRYGALQGKLLKVERYEGSQLKRTEEKAYNYTESDLPYPAAFGNLMYFANPGYAMENLVVLRKSVITQQGRTFTWEVPSGCAGGLTGYCFDLYGRPTKAIKSSAP